MKGIMTALVVGAAAVALAAPANAQPSWVEDESAAICNALSLAASDSDWVSIQIQSLQLSQDASRAEAVAGIRAAASAYCPEYLWVGCRRADRRLGAGTRSTPPRASHGRRPGHRRRESMIKKAAVGGLIACAALVLAPVAQAEPTGGGGSQFLDIVHAHIAGLTHRDGDSGLVDLGQKVCAALAARGGDRDALQQQLANEWSSESDAAWFITASAVALCPEYIVTSDRW